MLKSQKTQWYHTLIKKVKKKKDYEKVKEFISSQEWEEKNTYLKLLDECFPQFVNGAE